SDLPVVLATPFQRSKRETGCPRALIGPEVRHAAGVALGVGDTLRDDHELRVAGLVVPDRAHHLGRDPDRRARLGLDHLVAELELELPGDDEVDLFLLAVEVPVRALPARVLR